jgi:hypothetical protein
MRVNLPVIQFHLPAVVAQEDQVAVMITIMFMSVTIRFMSAMTR